MAQKVCYTLIVFGIFLPFISQVRAAFEHYLFAGGEPKSPSVFACLREAGITGLKLNVFLGKTQASFVENYKRAAATGFKLTEFWVGFYPNIDGNHPPEIPVNAIANSLRQVGAEVSRIWITINDAYWYDDEEDNRNYLLGIVEAFDRAGLAVGIDTDYVKWRVIFGSSFTSSSLTSRPLMYEDDDGEPSFNDWPENQFGGWSAPTAKEYLGYISECGAELNGVWRPGRR